MRMSVKSDFMEEAFNDDDNCFDDDVDEQESKLHSLTPGHDEEDEDEEVHDELEELR